MPHSLPRVALCAALLLSSGPMAAQSVLKPAGAPPAVLRVYRAWPTVGHESRAHAAGAGFPAISRQFSAPDYYVGAAAITGKAEVLWFEGFATHADLERQQLAMMSMPALAAAGDSVWREVASHLDGGDVLLAFHRPDLGYRPAWITPATRGIQVITFRIRPGLEADFEAVAKTFAAAYGAAGVDAPWTTYQVTNGLTGPTYLMIVPMASLATIDRDLAAQGAVMSKVADFGALMDQWARSGSSILANLYVVVPAMSRVPDDFTAGGADFWAAP